MTAGAFAHPRLRQQAHFRTGRGTVVLAVELALLGAAMLAAAPRAPRAAATVTGIASDGSGLRLRMAAAIDQKGTTKGRHP